MMPALATAGVLYTLVACIAFGIFEGIELQDQLLTTFLSALWPAPLLIYLFLLGAKPFVSLGGKIQRYMP